MARHFKVHEILENAPDDLEALKEFARNPGHSVDDCVNWLVERDYAVNRTSVWRWRQAFLMKERMGRSGELARTIKEAVQGGDFSDVAEAAAMQLTQVVFEQASCLEADGKIDPLDIQRMTRSLANLVGSKMGLVKLLAEKFDKEMAQRQEKSGDRKVSAEDIAEARRAIFGV